MSSSYLSSVTSPSWKTKREYNKLKHIVFEPRYIIPIVATG